MPPYFSCNYREDELILPMGVHADVKLERCGQ